MKIGRKTRTPSPKKEINAEESSLARFRISSVASGILRDIGRRRVDFAPLRLLVIPSFCIDFTELLLRQSGEKGQEKFVIWAGSLVGETGFLSTIVIPHNEGNSGLITSDVSASAYQALDRRDLVPLAQVHSHPSTAFLSPIDQENPFFMYKGFLSIVIPNFGFVDMMDVANWKVYQYLSKGKWIEFSREKLSQKIVIDDSVINV